MAKIFNDVSFDELRINNEIVKPDYTSKTNLSDFPFNIDKLKDLTIEDASINALNGDLNRYYTLLMIYLKENNITIEEINELKSLIAKLSKYNLTGYDYNLMRDSILEVFNYLNSVNTQFTSENGAYNAMKKSAEDFALKLNKVIDSINEKYGNLEEDPILGRIFPNGSITENYLDNNLKNKINAVEGLNGFIIIEGTEEDVQNYDLSIFTIKPLILADEGAYV